MSEPIIIPSVVAARWREALAQPSIQRWRSLAQMLGAMVINASLYAPESPAVDDLRTLAHVANIHMLAMQPSKNGFNEWGGA